MFFSLPLLSLLIVVVAGWSYFFSTGGLYPDAQVRPFYRRLLLMLPGLVMALHIEASEYGRAAALLIVRRPS